MKQHYPLLKKTGIFVILMINIFAPIKGWLSTTHTFTIEASNPQIPEPIYVSKTIRYSDSTNHIMEEEIEVVEEPKQYTVEEYIYLMFGEDAERGLHMLKTCENSTLNPDAINWNKNGTWDKGVWQINQIHGYTLEQLSDPYFNTEVAYTIFKSWGYTFTAWSCAEKAGDVPFYKL